MTDFDAEHEEPETFQDPWLRYIPSLHGALNGGYSGQFLPNGYRGLSFDQTCAWWETLRYLFRQILGWRDLALGLGRWYEAALPDLGEPSLKLVKRLWNTDGELDLFAAREWTQPGSSIADFHFESEFRPGYEPRPGWWQEFRKRRPLAEGDPFHGGTNPLHLGHSDDLGFHDSTGQCIGHSDRTARKATVVVCNLHSWVTDLEHFHRSLPDLGGRSWRIRVFDPYAGSLGTYRKSRVSGRWFSGRHSVHALAIPEGSG